MRGFGTAREAKEYLIGRIAGAAAREGIEFSEIERKMLYFSESGWILPNMLEVNEKFEREYDNDEYERKVAALIRGILSRLDRTPNEIEDWDNAVRKLIGEDHYLLVLIDLAGRNRIDSGSWGRWLPSLNTTQSKRPKGDIFRLVVVAIVLVATLLVLVVLRAKPFR